MSSCCFDEITELGKVEAVTTTKIDTDDAVDISTFVCVPFFHGQLKM